MSRDGRVWLSHSGIENLERCPRCFWLAYKKNIYQPEGIVSRLANRFDAILKNYFNLYRPLGELPPMAKDLPGKLENPFQEKYFVEFDSKYGFWGKLDECLKTDDGLFIPLDFKTASSDPRSRELLKAYQAQIDDYLFLLEKAGKKTPRFGYLLYVYPDAGKSLHDGFPMIIHIVKVEGDPARTVQRILHAKDFLEKDMPTPSANCPFCNWYQTLRGELKEPVLKRAKPAKKYIQEKLI